MTIFKWCNRPRLADQSGFSRNLKPPHARRWRIGGCEVAVKSDRFCVGPTTIARSCTNL